MEAMVKMEVNLRRNSRKMLVIATHGSYGKNGSNLGRFIIIQVQCSMFCTEQDLHYIKLEPVSRSPNQFHSQGHKYPYLTHEIHTTQKVI